MTRRIRGQRLVAALSAVAWLWLAGPAAGADVSFPGPPLAGTALTLMGQLEKPPGDGPFPAVVLLHGCNGPWPPWGAAWSDRLVDWGYVALRVDSFGPRGFPAGVCGQPFAVGARARAADAFAARDYLGGRGFVDPARIAVLGMSHGGWGVMAAVGSPYPGAPARPQPFRAAIAFYPHCDPLLHGLNAPLLILAGEADDWTPAWRCQDMEVVPPTPYAATLKVYPGATHAFDIDRPELNYLGHVMRHDADATRDAAARVRAFLERNAD